ncbi:MAG: restriction endonuclease subunit S, partial [Bacillota bacterium]|nr:restriction endonuclease subunit S [Bacillota bacterium]
MVETKRLGDIATYINGYAFKPDDWCKEGLPIVRIQDLTGTSYQQNYYKGDYPAKIEINDGDVLISWSASLGVHIWDRGKALLNQHIFKVVFDKVEVDKQYFVYAVQYNLENMLSKMHGATMKHIVKKDFDNIEVPFPTLVEQKRVASILAYAKDAIEDRKQQLTKLDNLVKSRFVEMFGDLKSNTKGWNINTFEELTYLITDGEHATPRRTDKGIYLLSARNVLNHSIQLENVDYIDQEEYDRIAKRVIPQAGDVLISCSGTVGRCCKVPEGLKFQMVRSAALLRFKEIINPVFAEYMVTSDYLQEQINSSKTASSQANLFQGKIKALKGIVPPRELQDEFADFVVQVDKSKVAIQAALDKTQL